MKKRLIIALLLFLILTTITSQHRIITSKFDLAHIEIEDNFLLKDKDIKKLLDPILYKNLIFLNNSQVAEALTKSDLIESFSIKKKYPNTLRLKIVERKPIAILVSKKKKFYVSEKIDLIDFNNIKNYENLPYVFGSKDEFKILYNNLKEINFPFDQVKKYILYESNRWDIETLNNKLIKLPKKNYSNKLKNYQDIKNQDNFKKYKIFDYRIKDQLILK